MCFCQFNKCWLSVEHDLDGELFAVALGCGPECLKEAVPSLSKRLKLLGAIQVLRASFQTTSSSNLTSQAVCVCLLFCFVFNAIYKFKSFRVLIDIKSAFNPIISQCDGYRWLKWLWWHSSTAMYHSFVLCWLFYCTCIFRVQTIIHSFCLLSLHLSFPREATQKPPVEKLLPKCKANWLLM